MRRAIVIIVVFVATRAFCFGDSYGNSYDEVPLFIESHWQTFSNISCFKEFYSTTNLPPEVRNSLVYVYPAQTESGFMDPGVTTTNGSRLIWAATDGTNYVVHWEIASTPVHSLQDALEESGGPNYRVTAAIREVESTNFIISTGPCYDRFNPLNDYKAFIDYETCRPDLNFPN